MSNRTMSVLVASAFAAALGTFSSPPASAADAAMEKMMKESADAIAAGKMEKCYGVALKAQHYRAIISHRPDIGFFEIHAENYMGEGGPPHRYLAEIRNRYPISLHGVGLSIGADRPLDRDHLRRLKLLIEHYEPGL